MSVVTVAASADTVAMHSDSSEHHVSAASGLGPWIWTDTTSNEQSCQFWKSFEIPASSTVKKARLLTTTDNEFTLFLDGQELGRGADWRELFDFNLTSLLTPGRHTLAISAYNAFAVAGMTFGLQVALADGGVIEVKSDQSWRIVPEGVKGWKEKTEAPADWPAATVVGNLGVSPRWTNPDAVNVMPGIQVLKLRFWQTGWFQIALLSVCGLVILTSLRLLAQLALHKKERVLLKGERARIARDIHDDLGSKVIQLVLHGELAQNELPPESPTRQQLNSICDEARGLLTTVDEVLWAVNPQRDTLRDFAAYVCNYAQKFLKPTRIQCFFDIDPEMSAATFDLPLRRSLLMAIKETLNNAVKHSEATELRLKIRWQDQKLVVVVQDDGKGFDSANITSGRNGLSNMTQRMSELGGSCLITSHPGQGCRVEFSIPLSHLRQTPLAWIWNAKQFSEQVDRPQSNEDYRYCVPTLF